MEFFDFVCTNSDGEKEDLRPVSAGYVNPFFAPGISKMVQAKELIETGVYDVFIEEKKKEASNNYHLLKKNIEYSILADLYCGAYGTVFYSVRSISRRDLSLIIDRSILPERDSKIGFLHGDGLAPERRFLTEEEMENLRAAINEERTLKKDLLVLDDAKDLNPFYLNLSLERGCRVIERFSTAESLLSYLKENYPDDEIPTVWVYKLESLLGSNYPILEELNKMGVSIMTKKIDFDFYPLLRGRYFAIERLNSKDLSRIIRKIDGKIGSDFENDIL